MRLLIIFLTLTLIVSCKTISSIKSINDIEQLSKQVKHHPNDVIAIHKQVIKTKESIEHDVKSVSTLFALLKQVIDEKWGKENSEFPKSKKYVKYSNDYQARAIVDFTRGIVSVETIALKNTQHTLTKAITTTLLTPADPRKTDIFSSKAPELGDEPFLFQQVIDQDNKAIRYTWRANRFAQYLVQNHLTSRKSHGKTITYVSFKLIEQHQHLRKQKFSQYVLASAKKYQIAPALIYAIIETESSFNPYAVSHANAYGLMQVVPATAGKDVYQKIKNRSGQPSRTVLFDPQSNIDIGTAYLSILTNNYLYKINSKHSKEYAVISGYNGGAGNVLRTFNHNRTQAFNQINSLSAPAVYQSLTQKHPRQESRRYLEKVTLAKVKYQ